ncbi:3-hydroxyacyl-CoA dehydrogenase NAD-binding domain-containing protein [Pseudarthrobacter sp. AB1]|uniref:3-hydroxyacyl-CoA dehydrogenase NAD-binding domain-containing protein n=1 Tax=Pseudarthrobacter sp. AB1 TaxID=2138309 RepID=UPI00186B97F6|nr:3-hydroxyacyl-CoA dehydrogenase NAD-binding domain-containing protein [Pseudarthrobacter sp. AB1]
MSKETVTNVSTEYFERAGFRIALLTLDNGSRRPETLGPASLTNLAAAIQSVETGGTDAVAVTGTGHVFCAGADLKQMTEATTREQAEDVAARGLAALGRLHGLTIPTFAFLNGIALGGGLELALHAQYRTAADSVRALGFPEVRLGLIPGWGGIPLATALAGTDATARLVITDSLAGRHLSAGAAAKLGLVDAVLPEDGFLEASLDFAVHVLSGRHGRRTVRPADQGRSLKQIRSRLDARLHGAAPAPYRALELIDAAARSVAGTGGTAAAGRDAEIRAFGELLLSDEARASIYAFNLTQSLARKPAGVPTAEPRPVRSVGVVGAGLMASQLALVFARQLRVPVLLTDLSTERIDKALAWIEDQLRGLVDRGQLDAAEAKAIRALVSGTSDKADFADCDAVIEAVFEELETKRRVFAELESLLRPDALLLTNTSSLSVEAMGAGLAHPGRLIGFHFFNPVAVLPLVELVATPRTDESTIATAFELAKSLRKTAVIVKDAPGFVVNRLLSRLFSEILQCIDNGDDPAAVDHALDPLGLPMTPLRLLQFIGPQVQLHICETLHLAYPDRFAVSPSLTAVAGAGLPGYLADDGGISPDAARLLPPAAPADPVAVRARVLAALAEEVEIMLAQSVAAGPEQIDLCMILGANYPFHTGGLTPLLDRETGSNFRPGLPSLR